MLIKIKMCENNHFCFPVILFIRKNRDNIQKHPFLIRNKRYVKETVSVLRQSVSFLGWFVDKSKDKWGFLFTICVFLHSILPLFPHAIIFSMSEYITHLISKEFLHGTY